MKHTGRVLVPVNPGATSARELGPKVMDNLAEHFGRTHVVPAETIDGTLAQNQEHFAGLIQAGDLVVTVSGDGGFRMVGAALLHPEMQDVAASVTLTTVGGGEASDMTKTLHGTGPLPSPSQIVQMGRIRSSHPLYCTAGSIQAGIESHPAFSYIGFGVSAVGAATVNSNAYRSKGWIRRELGLVHQLLTSKATFIPETVGRRDLQPADALSELTVVIGSRMAKYGKVDVDPWDPFMWTMRVKPGAMRAAAGLIGLAAGRPPGRIETTPVIFYTGTQVLAHCDGETFLVPEGSTVGVERHSTAVNLLASKGQPLSPGSEEYQVG